MTTAIFYPAVSGDDGYFDGWSTLDTATNIIANGNNAGAYTETFVRFADVTISPGDTITSAFVRFVVASTSATDARRDCYTAFFAADDAAAPTIIAELTGASKTGSQPTWTLDADPVNPGDIFVTVDLSTALQEVIDRGGWASGNAVVFKTWLAGAVYINGLFNFYTINYSGGAYKPELHVVYGAITDPTDISGCTAWHAMDLNPVLSDGTTLDVFVDQTGNGHYFYQWGGQPGGKYRTNQINGLPALQFIPAEFREMLSFDAFDAGTFFCVAYADSTMADGGCLLRDTINKSIWQVDGSNWIAGAINHRENAVVTDVITFDTWVILDADIGTPTTRQYYLGCSSLITNNWKGFVAELIFYDTILSAGLRSLVYDYLYAKYFPAGGSGAFEGNILEGEIMKSRILG